MGPILPLTVESGRVDQACLPVLGGLGVLGFRGSRVSRGLGFRGLGFRGLGFRV